MEILIVCGFLFFIFILYLLFSNSKPLSDDDIDTIIIFTILDDLNND